MVASTLYFFFFFLDFGIYLTKIGKPTVSSINLPEKAPFLITLWLEMGLLNKYEYKKERSCKKDKHKDVGEGTPPLPLEHLG